MVTASAQNLQIMKLKLLLLVTDTIVDEVPFAELLSNLYSTHHHVEIVKNNDLLEILPKLIWHLDDPSSDSTIVSQYIISNLASKYVKVCLTGIGGDELFGGYGHYLDLRERRLRKIFKEKQFFICIFCKVI